MNLAFADTSYWIALINWNDDLHHVAIAASRGHGSRRLVTTDTVLIEVLNYFAEFGPAMREMAAGLVRDLLQDESLDVLALDRGMFLAGLDMYDRRRDKGYSFIDCHSMYIAAERRILDILTYDHHFEQEGFRALLRVDPQ